MKKILAVLLALAATATMSVCVMAQAEEAAEEQAMTVEAAENEAELLEEAAVENAVAKVGTGDDISKYTPYATIDEAIAAWTNNKTLVLVDDVQLTDVVKIKSTEHHILNLGTYTMTAAEGKNAIEIIASGTGKGESNALTVNADANTPGGIDADNLSAIYYNYSKGDTTLEDRPIINIKGGVFEGSTNILSWGNSIGAIYGNGTAARKCPTFNISGGIFNGSMVVPKGKVIISGGTFNIPVTLQGDVTAYRLISGGRFAGFSFLTAGPSNGEQKLTFGSAKNVMDANIIIDEDGYIIVTTKADDLNSCEALVTPASSINSYFQYSNAKNVGVYYKDANMAAVSKGTLCKVLADGIDFDTDITLNSSRKNLTIDCVDGTIFTGDVTLGHKDATFTVVFDSEKPYTGTVTPCKGYVLNVTETQGTTITRTYSNGTAYAKIDEDYYGSLEEALAEVENGETITLLEDIEISSVISFDKAIDFVLDGNNHSISLANDYVATANAAPIVLGNSNLGDDDVADRKYELKNITFTGITPESVLRVQGVELVIDECVFTKNIHSVGSALLRTDHSDVTVKNSTFADNTASIIIANNWNVYGGNSDTGIEIINCTFSDNIINGTGVIQYAGGNSLAISKSEFVGNTVNTTGNGAVVYLGFGDNASVTGCLFKDNKVDTTGTSNRVAGALQSGNDEAVITGNAFVNNVATRNSAADPKLAQVNEAGYYGVGNLSSNYWSDGDMPEFGVDIVSEYGYHEPSIEDYYGSYSIDTDGNVVLGNLKYVVKNMKIGFADATSADAEGEKVYDIIITAPEKEINRLNSVDLSFALTVDDGAIDYEIIDIADDKIAINNVNNLKDRYEFHFETKTDVTNDSGVSITLGQVKFTGYGKFDFAVDASVKTNAAHATENEDNIVDTFVPGGVLEDGTKVGTLDISDNTITDILITVPTRTLTINLSFPNAVENKISAYQQMKVTVSGGDLGEAIVVELGSDAVMPVIKTSAKPSAKVEVTADSVYQVVITDALTANVAYNVEVSGAGYRTARYTVTMQGEDKDGKILNFWNNVKDNALEVEEGKATSAKTVTYLAGDIVKDSLINIYDLSAVVSYFGEEMDTDEYNAYAKYDLNRDGKIDSKDVAYVLVSWGK